MNTRTRTRDEINDTPPAPSNNEEEEKKEDGPPPPQRPRTEPPPSETEPLSQTAGPPGNSGGGGLNSLLDRNGIRDSSRPPSLQDRNEMVLGAAVHSFKPIYLDRLTAETFAAFNQNRTIAWQTCADRQFAAHMSISDAAMQEMAILLLQLDGAIPIWNQSGETRRMLEPRLHPEDLTTMIKLLTNH